ncbi:MAG TPA: sulfurtransferase [Bacteroidota bacterium]|jgi:thiosulfate/3-mercaptopyruvate sulfurtransferase|nr:sulfurtransferase [Bacteroidota bacterium]
MMRSLVVLCLTVVLVVAAGASEKAPILVTPEWLSQHLNDPDIVVLNVSQNARFYRQGHIPGARFLWVTSFAAPNPELSFELVPPDQLVKLFEGLGVSNTSRIILCSVNGNVSPTARAYITLEYLGMGDRTSILDGGYEAWKKAGNKVSTETPSVKRSSFTPHLKKEAIVDGDYVKSHLKTRGVTILDARAPEFYNGIGGGFPRPGHVPGAVNVYFGTLFDSTNKYLPLDSIRAKYAAAGIKDGDDIITYCHVGQTASSDYIGAKLLGHEVHLYDGSFEDWSGREDTPIEVPAKQDSLKKP